MMSDEFPMIKWRAAKVVIESVGNNLLQSYYEVITKLSLIIISSLISEHTGTIQIRNLRKHLLW